MPRNNRVEIQKSYEFEAAHFLPFHDGKCRKLHGHTWKLDICVSGVPQTDEGPQHGMVMDFYLIKEIIKEIDPDHTLLNSYRHQAVVCADMHRWKFMLDYPTCELMAQWLFDLIEPKLPEGVDLEYITVHETKTGSATVFNEEYGR
jgi:6-pyruvoyltetrahydropterin/6-carboxytetrahydropterin synthase